MKELRLKDKCALVTGSSRGIGRAIALRLARAGANVSIDFDRHEDEASEVLAVIRAFGRKAMCTQADISDVNSARNLVRRTVDGFGHLDIVVNNAGVEIEKSFFDVTEIEFEKVMNVILKGTFFVSQEFARYVRESNRSGKIINISSVHEDLPFPRFASYAAAKGALRMLTRTLAIELAPYRMTVNNVAPGAIETEINQALLKNPEHLNDLLKKIPLRRMGKTDDVAAITAFLASSDADYVTGSTYVVDGGLTYNYEEKHGN